MELAPGVVIAGKYQLEQPLARGGMGSVWVAKHLQLKVALAIKFMEPAYASSAVGRARFEREATASAQLRHANVVHVQDYGVQDDFPYIVMELLHGEDLGKRLKRRRKISIAAAASIVSQAAKALRRAHEAGFIHRDLKPSNIFLARDPDEEGEIVKILDFGIAKQLATASLLGDTEHTRTGEIVGSPSYMSPEQIRSARDIDGRSDLWSLGVILFRALTGQLPFKAETTVDIIAKILAGPIPSAVEIAPELPPALDGFFARALARDRDQRFQTAREMAEAFSAVARQTLPSMSGVDMPAPYSAPDSVGTASPSSSLAHVPPQLPEGTPSSVTGSTSMSPVFEPSSPQATLHPTPEPHSGSFVNAQTYSGSIGSGSDPLGLKPTVKPPPKPTSPGALADSPTIAPSSGGTLTVSPSITGSDAWRPPRRAPVLWWVIGASTIIGAGLAVSIILANRPDETDPTAASTPQGAQSADAPLDPSAPTPAPLAAQTAAEPSPNVSPAGSLSLAPSGASSSKAASSSSAKTKRPPVPGRTPTGGKKNDWGI